MSWKLNRKTGNGNSEKYRSGDLEKETLVATFPTIDKI